MTMRKSLMVFGLIMTAAMISSGCSTTGRFKLPPDTQLQVTDRDVRTNEAGEWKTSPFFWSTAGGAFYRLTDKEGNLIRTGKLKTSFRVVSIFWPPLAIVYWPMGLSGTYDLTGPADGYRVTDNGGTTPASTAPAPKKKK